MVKRSYLKDYVVTRFSKPMAAIKLKETDSVVNVFPVDKELALFTKDGYSVRFDKDEIPVTKVKSSGVKGINLKDDEVISGINVDPYAYIDIFTNQNTAKRIKPSDIPVTKRAKKGIRVIKKVKTVNYELIKVLSLQAKDTIILKSDSEIKEIKNSDIAIFDLTSTGSTITKRKIDTVNKKCECISFLNKEKKEPSEKDHEERKNLSIDDFLDDFKI